QRLAIAASRKSQARCWIGRAGTLTQRCISCSAVQAPNPDTHALMYAEGPSMPLGRYHLLALLGQGGMADVFLACTRGPAGLRKLLVVTLARFTGEPMLATIFLDEARIAAQLEHPNIVQTYEIAQDGSRHYI